MIICIVVEYFECKRSDIRIFESAQRHLGTTPCVSLDRGSNPGVRFYLRDCVAVGALDAKQAQGNGCNCADSHPSSASDQDGGDHARRTEADDSLSPHGHAEKDPASSGCPADPDKWGTSEQSRINAWLFSLIPTENDALVHPAWRIMRTGLGRCGSRSCWRRSYRRWWNGPR